LNRAFFLHLGGLVLEKTLGKKIYYTISEVAELTHLKPYTLRAWEKEFACLRPKRLGGKNRAYRNKDIGIVLLLKRLIYGERFTTQGVVKKLKEKPTLLKQAEAEFTSFIKEEKEAEVQVLIEDATKPLAPVINVKKMPIADHKTQKPVEWLNSARHEIRDILDLLSP
jgi:DNA-binding transcriptional MerR regulator